MMESQTVSQTPKRPRIDCDISTPNESIENSADSGESVNGEHDVVVGLLDSIYSTCMRLSAVGVKGGKGSMSKQDALTIISIVNEIKTAYHNVVIRSKETEGKISILEELKSLIVSQNALVRPDMDNASSPEAVIQVSSGKSTEKNDMCANAPKNQPRRKNGKRLVKGNCIVQPENEAASSAKPTFAKVMANGNCEWKKVQGPHKRIKNVVINDQSSARPKQKTQALVIHSDTLKADEIRNLIQNHVKPGSDGLRIKAVRKTKKDGLIIVTDASSDLRVIKDNAQLKEVGLRIEPPRPSLPKLKILRVQNELSEDQVKNAILRQNFDEAESKAIGLRVLFKKGSKTDEKVDWVFECNPDAKTKILGLRRLYVEWDSCWVREYITPLRCFKCHEYGHMSRACVSTADICSHCAEPGHRGSQCPNIGSDPTCVVCKARGKSHDHKIAASTCWTHSQQVTRMKRLNAV